MHTDSPGGGTARKALVSACLLGSACRYDGRDCADPAVRRFLESRGLTPVPVCPEELGGLGTPRPRAEIREGDGGAVLAGRGRVFDFEGRDVTGAFIAGARAALELALRHRCGLAVLKAGSPSCGSVRISAGDFSGRTRAGSGVTSALLKSAGIRVVTEEDIPEEDILDSFNT
ncbi:MAG: DUF523 domain-containing protein [Firmicutes bacterium]|nr:DUF523 domain-containing protein [Bacillota bacterium]